MHQQIKIVLVGTTHPGNIGAVARAMKNMGLNRLVLVDPKIFPSADATSRASGAHDLLANAEVHETLDHAIADCSLVFGASARSRTISWPEKSVRECAQMARDFTAGPVAFVFGREHSGLTNQELDRCHYLLRIPCNPDFSSLNLAAAVQVVTYELLMASHSEQPAGTEESALPGESPPATAAQMESFFQHLSVTLTDIGFMHADKSKSIMRRLRRLFNRSRLEHKELDILRGILSAAQNHNRE